MTYAVVALGGILGSLMRWLVALALPMGDGLPWGTFLANASGCFAIGLYNTLAVPGGLLSAGPRMRVFVMTGICGGYTTFSGFSLETFLLTSAGDPGAALVYVGSSLLSWLAAVWLGDAVAHRLNRL